MTDRVKTRKINPLAYFDRGEPYDDNILMLQD